MAYEIKVTVEAREIPSSNKFEELAQLAKRTKQLANESITSCNAVTEMIGKEKFKAILEQLEYLKKALLDLNNIKGSGVDDVIVSYPEDWAIRIWAQQGQAGIQYRKYYGGSFYTLEWDDSFVEENGLLIIWNDANFIEKLERQITDKYQRFVDSWSKKDQEAYNRMNKISK